VTEYHFEVPRDWTSPASSPPLTLFARAARRQHAPADPTGEDKGASQPWMAYLQGGPGFGCTFPQSNAWATTLMDRGYQVLCLDQRGTGLSEPLSASSLGLRGDERAQARFLRAFRADSIVRDCEAVRRALTAGWPAEKQRWSILGQSYGGFCATTYLSYAPEGLREVFVFGGLQPLVDQPDEVYRATFKRVIKRNEGYYKKFPEDVEKVQKIVTFLQRFGNTTVKDSSDTGFMTARRFLQLGLGFGFHGSSASLTDVNC
jgi:pimeloyl-ACP methyl ester carboxylesterase